MKQTIEYKPSRLAGAGHLKRGGQIKAMSGRSCVSATPSVSQYRLGVNAWGVTPRLAKRGLLAMPMQRVLPEPFPMRVANSRNLASYGAGTMGLSV